LDNYVDTFWFRSAWIFNKKLSGVDFYKYGGSTNDLFTKYGW
jgi:hypothetical protein